MYCCILSRDERRRHQAERPHRGLLQPPPNRHGNRAVHVDGPHEQYPARLAPFVAPARRTSPFDVHLIRDASKSRRSSSRHAFAVTAIAARRTTGPPSRNARCDVRVAGVAPPRSYDHSRAIGRALTHGASPAFDYLYYLYFEHNENLYFC